MLLSEQGTLGFAQMQIQVSAPSAVRHRHRRIGYRGLVLGCNCRT